MLHTALSFCKEAMARTAAVLERTAAVLGRAVVLSNSDRPCILSTCVLLQAWVRDVLEAQNVLDYQTGRRYSKLQVHTLPPLQLYVLSLLHARYWLHQSALCPVCIFPI